MTQCAKIIVGFMVNVGNVFIKRSQTFFLNFFRNVFLRCLTFFLIFISTLTTSVTYSTTTNSNVQSFTVPGEDPELHHVPDETKPLLSLR